MIDVRSLLTSMVERNASDLYVTADSPALYRIDGVCHPVTDLLDGEATAEIARFFLSEEQRETFRKNQEMNLAYSIPTVGRFRVNIFVQRGHVGLVIRLVKIQIPTLDELGMPESLKAMVLLKRGLVLITGPTGAGKSTTLAAMVDYRNSLMTGHILTVEDPIEFVHPHKKSIVTQREVGMDTRSYHDALVNALRQAPDVVLIGEIRDEETMSAALHFTETGHLVLGTLHTSNANQTLDRVINFFPKEQHATIFLQLSLNLGGIVCQRLIPVASGEGRRVALEVLLGTPRIRDLIQKGEVGEIRQAMEESTQEGCQTFDHALYLLYRENVITLEEALKNAESANNLRIKVKMEGGGETAPGEAPKRLSLSTRR